MSDKPTRSDYPLLISLCVGALVKDVSIYKNTDECRDKVNSLCSLIATVSSPDKASDTSLTLRELDTNAFNSISKELAILCNVDLQELSDEDVDNFHHFTDLVIRSSANMTAAIAFITDIKSK